MGKRLMARRHGPRKHVVDLAGFVFISVHSWFPSFRESVLPFDRLRTPSPPRGSRSWLQPDSEWYSWELPGLRVHLRPFAVSFDLDSTRPRSQPHFSSQRARSSKEVTEADPFLCDLDPSLCALCVKNDLRKLCLPYKTVILAKGAGEVRVRSSRRYE